MDLSGRFGSAERVEELLELVASGALQVELHPLEAVLVGMRAEASPEAADLAVDGGTVPPRSLEPSQAAGLVPGDPEGDQLGVFDDGAGDLIADESPVVLDGPDGEVALGQGVSEGGGAMDPFVGTKLYHILYD